MRIRQHITTSALLSAVLFYFIKSPPMAIGAFASGILIDLDHVLDCYLNYGLKFNLFKTNEVCEFARLKKVTWVFHSYEFVLIFSLWMFLFKKWGIWYGITAGVFLHMLLDQFYNYVYSNSYFFLKRALVRFNVDKIVDIDAQLKRYEFEKR